MLSDCLKFSKLNNNKKNYLSMKGKLTKGSRLRLSPNEEAQLIREELERRRKLRVQQVREQERYVALQVRREMKERKEKEFHRLADTLRDEWQTQRRNRIQSLEKLCEDSVRSVGQGHRSAEQNEPDWNSLAWKREWNEEQAAERHQRALRDLMSCRRAQEEQRSRRIEARQKALIVEKDRAAKVANLPPPAPNPIENIGVQTLPPSKMANLEHYSITHYHVPETVVHRETSFEQPHAQQAALLEAQRLEELEREEECGRKEQLEKAQLRGNHALQKERVVQDQARLLCELEHLHQAELHRRSRAANSVPPHIFQPLYRLHELRTEHQEKLEIAFQNLYTSEKEVKGDLVLQLVPEPLPAPSVGSHDEDLDVTLDKELEITPHEEADEWPGGTGTQPVGPSHAVRTDRQPLRRLLERIRNQREHWMSKEDPVGQGKASKDNSSTETGSISIQETEQPLHPEQDTPHNLEIKSGKMCEDPLVAGSMLRPVEKLAKTTVQERELLRQQEEQLTLLQELEEKRYSLELQLQEAKQYKQKLKQALPLHSGTCSLQNVSTEPQDVAPIPAPDSHLPAGVEVQEFTLLSESMHKQRLLDQERLHKKCVGDAWRHLEEYQRALKLRYEAINATAAQLHLHPVTKETICTFPSLTHMAHNTDITNVLDVNTGLPVSLETPQCYHFPATQPQTSADPTQNLLPKPPEPPFSTSDTHPEVNLAQVSTLGASSLSEYNPTDGATQLEEIPLPPPSVVLELLLSRQTFLPDTKLASLSLHSHEDAHEDGRSEVETRWWSNEQMRKRSQQTPVRAEPVKVESSALVEESNKLLSSCTSHCHACTCSSSLVSSEPVSCVCKSEHCVQMKTPVSHPPRTLQILLRDLVQHKLSTIQEVDTPASVRLGKGAETFMQRSSRDCLDHSESISVPVSSPSVESGVLKGQISASDAVSSENSSGRVSRPSWRETLQIESTSSNAQSTITGAGSIDKSQLEGVMCVLHDGTCVEPDHLSSTTISTGSCSTYKHDANYSKTDSSLFNSDSAGRTGASVTCSSSMFEESAALGNPQPKFNSGLQCIIDRYTNELDSSLRDIQTDAFQPLSPVVTHNEMKSTLDLPVFGAFCSPPMGDSTRNGDTVASGLPNPVDLCLQSGFLDAFPEGLRSDGQLQSQYTLQMSLEEFLISNNSSLDTQKAAAFAGVSLLPHLSLHNDSVPEPPQSEVLANLPLHGFSTEHQSASGPADISKWKEILEPYSDKGIWEESEISLVSLSDTTLDTTTPTPLEEEPGGKREAKEKLEKEGVGGNKQEIQEKHNDMSLSSLQGKSQLQDTSADVSHAYILHTDVFRCRQVDEVNLSTSPKKWLEETEMNKHTKRLYSQLKEDKLEKCHFQQEAYEHFGESKD